MSTELRERWLRLIREWHQDMGNREIARMGENRMLNRTNTEVAAMFWLEVRRGDSYA